MLLCARVWLCLCDGAAGDAVAVAPHVRGCEKMLVLQLAVVGWQKSEQFVGAAAAAGLAARRPGC